MDYERKMDRARRRNSKSASGADGVYQIQKHKAASRLSSDSRPYFDACTINDMFLLGLEKSSDGRATGRLIKKLLEEGMLKETESRRRPPSGVSGLTVLEGHFRKQQKRISDSYESDDASDEENRHCSSRRRARSMLTNANHLHNMSRPDGSHTSFSRRADNSQKSSKALSEEKNKLPARIVVLRPNHHGNHKHDSGSSRYLSHRMKENTSVSAYDVRFSKSSSKEARLIAGEITRRMRGGFDETVGTKYSRFGQNTGDENSYDASESDLESDPEMSNLFSKKRLSEKRKITPRYDHNASLRHSRSDFTKKCRSCKQVFSSQDTKSRSKKHFPCKHICIDEIDSSSDAYSEIQMEAHVKDLSEKQLMLSEPRSTTSSSNSCMLHRKQSSVVDNDEAAAHDQMDLRLQELYKRPPGSSPLKYVGAEPTTSECSKEADHASPVSVLEASFIEDASSCSERFDLVSAEQNEGNYTLGAEGWESSYALDVLIHSGFLKLSLDKFTTKWHSPDCPLDPVSFDSLEKKYNNETTCLRSERRVVFDRLNSSLLEISQKHVDFRLWVRPKLSDLYYPTWQNERVGDALEKLIKQESASAQEQEKMIDEQLQWLGYEREIDAVGNAIVRLLINDLILELSW